MSETSGHPVLYTSRMLDLLLSNPIIFFISFAGLILSLTIHEFSHAMMADRLGDPTPRIQGRVTLNPLAHLDPFGTIAMLLIGFGWGKPVQFDPYNLKNPVRDSALIAIAGPASNMIIAIVLAIILRLNVMPSEWFFQILEIILITNVSLAIFNLVPVYPLDGSKILLAILPRDLAYEYESFMNRYGFFVLIALLLPLYGGMSPVSFLVSPVRDFLIRILV